MSRSLAGALQELAVRMSKTGKFRCNFHVNSPGLPVDTTVAGHLFRIAQEAVSNALKHGQAKHLEVGLGFTDGLLVLRIADDGVGMRDQGARAEGQGLRIMRYRADAIRAAACSTRRSTDPR